ncbi:hypothetical protein PLESTF_001374700 [Pleodorina starrii]|nr:hypothetical protein PLESTF_001374700 [Pleodorina starrii]
MSGGGALGVDLLGDITVTNNDDGSGRAAAKWSPVVPGENAFPLPADASHSSHERAMELAPGGVVDLLGDSPQPRASPAAPTVVAVGSPPVDLLGDEVVEAPSAAGQTPGENPPQEPAAASTSQEDDIPATPASPAEEPSGHTQGELSGLPSNQVQEQQQQLEPQEGTALSLTVDSLAVWQPELGSATEPGDAAATSQTADSESGRPEQQQPPAIEPPGNAAEELQWQEPGEPPATAAPPAAEPQARSATTAAESLDGGTAAADRASADGSGGGSQSLPSDSNPDGNSGDGGPSDDGSEAPSGQASDGDERFDSDREVVEEEDAFGDFADFTSASHFLPGGVGGGGIGLGFGQTQPPPSASAAAAARAAAASAGGPAGSSSPSAHRHAHLGPMARSMHGMLGAGGVGGGSQHHGTTASTASGAVSEHGSLGGEFSDFSHQSPPPSVAPSRGGGGRKSVASIASVGSRAGADDDLGDYGSVVGSSVWRAPSQMATSSYAAAAGADDDFGDFTSDITSTSDFAPSTQPPSAVAVSGPGSVHPDDDFGSFASHRSTADDDEDDFGNFNAAPAAAGAAGGAGPSGSGGAAAAAATAAAGGSGAAAAAGGSGGVASAVPGGAGAAAAGLSPRDAAAATAATAGVPHPYHSTQTVGPVVSPASASTSDAAAAGAAEVAPLQLPPAELRQAVARALQPLLPPGMPVGVGSAPQVLPDEQVVSAAWAQLRRHVQQGTLADAAGAGAGGGGIVAHNGVPLPPLPGSTAPQANGHGAAQDGSSGGGGGTGSFRSGYAPAVKFTRPLRWKGSDSERRLLAGLGLSELAAQARMMEAAAAAAAEGFLRQPGAGRGGRMDLAGTGAGGGGGGGGLRQMGAALASFGDAPRRMRADVSTMSAGLHRDTECDAGGPSGGSNGVAAGSGGSRSRGLEPNGEAGGPLQERVGGAGTNGGTPRAPGSANGFAESQQPPGGYAEK